jgi:propionate CoA-transferase
VDCVVVSRPENHWQTYGEVYNPAFSGEIRIPMQFIPVMEMSERKIIARRAAFELRPNSVVNLGVGMPEGIARVANEERIIEYLTLTAEPGVIGGMPNGGLNFGTGTNIDVLIDQSYQFDFYDGGGLDMAFLGMAQADMEGNVNVSRYGPRFVGPGGFINISQSSRKVVFVGTFTAGGLKVSIEDGKLRIIQEGKEKKFIARVDQKTFGGRYAAEKKRPVLYVTERCVFVLSEKGLELIEVAPGMDIQKDILDQMEFVPVMRKKPCPMDLRIFRPDVMGLREDLLTLPIEERLSYDPAANIFFVNFEKLHIKSLDEIKQIQEIIETMLGPLGKKVKTIVNYDNFEILPELIDEYADMVKYVTQFYKSTTRYTTSTFLRMKLGEELLERNVAPHIYETCDEARRMLMKE